MRIADQDPATLRAAARELRAAAAVAAAIASSPTSGTRLAAHAGGAADAFTLAAERLEDTATRAWQARQREQGR